MLELMKFDQKQSINQEMESKRVAKEGDADKTTTSETFSKFSIQAIKETLN